MSETEPPEQPPRPDGPRAPGRRRSRRRRGRGGEDKAAPGTKRPPPPVVPETSRLAAPGAPAAEPLSPAEVAEMKQHLAFLRAYKEALRVKFNAAEDLLVNGQREPADHGVCRHLLAKIDRAVIEQAIGREPFRSDPAARARMLGGAIRLTADVGVLLAYVETLAQVRSHAEAAAAFAEAVRRIDFEALSSTRLARLLAVLVTTFSGHERVQVLFSLLGLPAFRNAFDAGLAEFPPEVAEPCAPLRAVHRRLLEDGRRPDDPALLAAGLERVLSAPDGVLRAYAEPLRLRMLELALDPTVPAALADRAAGVLLGTLPRDSAIYARLALRRAAQLLRRHVDDRARGVLEEVRRAQPGCQPAKLWLGALGARRVGRVAVGGPPARGRLAPGFWLDGQRRVWVRTAVAPDAARLAEEARLQRGLGLPGIAPVVEDGVAAGIPYVAVAGAGAVLGAAAERPLELPAALALAAQAARILRALALAGVELPDAAPARFVVTDTSLVLADLDGAVARPPASPARQARDLVASLVVPGTLAGVAPELAAALVADAPDLLALIDLLDTAAADLGA